MDTFSALAEPTRRSIIRMLAERGELSASDISSRFAASPPAISQHLKVLREARLVRVEKRSRQRIYRINPSALDEMAEWVRQTTEMWHRRLERLDALLKADTTKRRGSRQHGK